MKSSYIHFSCKLDFNFLWNKSTKSSALFPPFSLIMFSTHSSASFHGHVSCNEKISSGSFKHCSEFVQCRSYDIVVQQTNGRIPLDHGGRFGHIDGSSNLRATSQSAHRQGCARSMDVAGRMLQQKAICWNWLFFDNSNLEAFTSQHESTGLLMAIVLIPRLMTRLFSRLPAQPPGPAWLALITGFTAQHGIYGNFERCDLDSSGSINGHHGHWSTLYSDCRSGVSRCCDWNCIGILPRKRYSSHRIDGTCLAWWIQIWHVQMTSWNMSRSYREPNKAGSARTSRTECKIGIVGLVASSRLSSQCTWVWQCWPTSRVSIWLVACGHSLRMLMSRHKRWLEQQMKFARLVDRRTQFSL